MSIESKIRSLAERYERELDKKISQRVKDMKVDDKSHYLIYHVLGITEQEGDLIDVYQNKGRFLYRYAGSLLEVATKLCFKEKYPDSGSLKIPNTIGSRPGTFEIDCLVGTDAHEIKWRDATTDGDHITKEHTRIKVIAQAGYTPIRIMFFYPNRAQAIRIQEALETLYTGIGGHYHFGDHAWDYVRDRTDIDLKAIFQKIAVEKTGEA